VESASSVPSREWGDGATDVRLHVIEDISYAADTIVCRCGALVHDILIGGWVWHGGSSLRLDDAAERGSEPKPQDNARAIAALAAIATLGRSCTCQQDVESFATCPNSIIPSDLEGGEDLDDTE